MRRERSKVALGFEKQQSQTNTFSLLYARSAHLFGAVPHPPNQMSRFRAEHLVLGQPYS